MQAYALTFLHACILNNILECLLLRILLNIKSEDIHSNTVWIFIVQF